MLLDCVTLEKQNLVCTVQRCLYVYYIPSVYVDICTYYIVVVQRFRRRMMIKEKGSKEERKEFKKNEKLRGLECDAIIMSERPGGRIYSYCR